MALNQLNLSILLEVIILVPKVLKYLLDSLLSIGSYHIKPV